jgi:hypothetical protein
MHPFLDTSKLTDEEIIDRIGKAYNYMNAQAALGHKMTADSIREVIHALEEEKRSRMFKSSLEESKKKNPNSNNPIELGKTE